MHTKKDEFNDTYKKKCGDIKWFEPYIQPKMLEEWNNQVIRKGMSLLDVGGGCSLDGIFYATNGINTTVLDFSPNAINKLKEMAEFFGVKIATVNCSILDVPISLYGVFDIVTDNGCFHHIDEEDRSLYFNSVANLVKTGGYLYIRAISEYVPPSSDSNLRAYRISSDDILCEESLKFFKVVEISLFDYVFNLRGRQKMWFIKLQRR